MTRDDVLASIRGAGFYGIGGVEAVVLETDGSLSVVRQGSSSGISTLENVNHPPLESGERT